MYRTLLISAVAAFGLASVSSANAAPFFANLPAQVAVNLQTGDYNTALQYQALLPGKPHPGIKQFSLVHQSGDYNQGVTVQVGTDQAAAIDQDGDSNAAAIGQNGSEQAALIVHNSDVNTGGISQVGQGQVAVIVAGN